MTIKCFACDREMKTEGRLVDTRDGQEVFVGPECYRRIIAAGETGWRPPKGGPRLYPMPTSRLIRNDPTDGYQQ